MKKLTAKKLVLQKQTVRALATKQLDRVRGGNFYMDSRITCDLECAYWSYFTR